MVGAADLLHVRDLWLIIQLHFGTQNEAYLRSRGRYVTENGVSLS